MPRDTPSGRRDRNLGIRVNCPDWMSHADAKNELRRLIEEHPTSLSTTLLKPSVCPTWSWPVKPRVKP